MTTASPRVSVLPQDVASGLRVLGARFGIRNIRVFGSFARGDSRPDSDVDLLVDYTPGQSGFAFVRFCREAETLLGRPVDVATERSLHPLIRDKILAEAIAV
jgi:predicted nucleotidyltransferase